MRSSQRRSRARARPSVVHLPAEIDSLNARRIGEQLGSALTPGAGTVIADMTATTFCDAAGAHELALAHKKAAAGGIELLLVMPSAAARRVFELTGLDQIVAICREWPPDLPEYGPMADSRKCEQCGSVFTPRREHARFCCVACRAAWNRDHVGDPAAEASALLWSITAMSETIQRLPEVRIWDRPRAFAAIGEAVWWLTIVDATLVRHHPGAYDRAMAAQARAELQRAGQTLAGLRFVRNQIGRGADLADLIEPGEDGPDGDGRRITGWTWRPVPDPALAWLPPRGQAWERTRYQAYRAQLAGHTIGESFGRAAEFLKLAAANAPSIAETSVHAAH